MEMEYKYLSYLVEAWNSNPYFDPREVQGCSEEEINELKALIAPYMQRMPKAVEEDLRLHGRYSFLGKGAYLVNKYEAVQEDEIDLVAELEMGFWATSVAQMGVLCDDKKLLKYLVGDYKYELVDYDDPPVIWKTGDLEDNDLEIRVSGTRYSRIYEPLIKQFMPQYTWNYENRPGLLAVKQSFLEFIEEIENCHAQMAGRLKIKFHNVIHQLRLLLTYMGVSGGLSMSEVQFQLNAFHNMGRGIEENFIQLRAFSNKIDTLYDAFKMTWEKWNKAG